ncbi:MAG TPA: DUF456 domain-containing protein [Firmicutes bacterium]|nr:DUF456 domain-containing protein [Bacillota bacterium]
MTETILVIIGYVVFHLILLVGLILNPTGLSGNLLIVINALVFSIIDKFERIPIWLLAVFLVFSGIGEAVEYFSSVVGSKKFGASNISIVFMLIFMIAGGILGASFTFGIGALIGAIIGAFLGALIGELISKKDFQKAFQAGTGAFMGRIVAWVVKTAIGIVMVFVILLLVWLK